MRSPANPGRPLARPQRTAHKNEGASLLSAFPDQSNQHQETVFSSTTIVSAGYSFLKNNRPFLKDSSLRVILIVYLSVRSLRKENTAWPSGVAGLPLRHV